MHRIDTNGHVGNMFDEGDPGVPRLPTQVDSEILNAFQEEPVSVILDAVPSIALVKNTNTQLLAAILSTCLTKGKAGRDGHGILDANGLLLQARGQANPRNGKTRFTMVPGGTHQLWITNNAAWNAGTSEWDKDGSAPAFALRITTYDDTAGDLRGAIAFMRYSGAPTSFADSAWELKGPDLLSPIIEREPATAPTLLNSFTNAGGGRKAAGFYADVNGRVHLEGTVTGGTAGTVIFTLPAAYRPSAICAFAASASNAFASVSVAANGDVTLAAGSGSVLSLDGISFGT